MKELGYLLVVQPEKSRFELIMFKVVSLLIYLDHSFQ